MRASVILPAYNAEKTIREAIDSVLEQTFRDFELIIINDGSTDSTHSIISDYKDNRIVYLQNDGNKGLIYTLNRGLETSKGEYIIRMDADDICFPHRFEKQIRFMDCNPDIAASGTQIYQFGFSENNQDVNPTSFEDLQYQIVITVPIFHPTAIIRKEALLRHNLKYNEDYKHTEDYKLWVDFVTHGEKLANIEEICLKYRISESQISNKFSKIQVATSQKIRTEYIDYLLKEHGITLDSKISYADIREYWTRLGSRYKNKYLYLILFFLYMSLQPPLYRISKCLISGDIARIMRFDISWGIKVLLSALIHKWDFYRLR